MGTAIGIKMEHVGFCYEKGAPILRDVTFSAGAGECVGLIGANGVGKSTLLRLLVGLNAGYSGRVQVCGLSVEKKNLPEIRRRAGYVFQDSDSQLFSQNVYEDVAFAPRNYGLPEDEVGKRAREALEMARIWHLREKQVYKMSGGEKKLAAIAGVLAMRPDILLMDEPTISLDPKNRRNLIHILNGLGQLKVIATHDLDMALDTCSRVALMADGKIVRDGPAKEILSDQELLEAHGLELPLCLQGLRGNGISAMPAES